MKRFMHWLGVSLLILSSACSELNPPRATATPQPIPSTLTPTATIVWFPPSATPTATQIILSPPTPEQRPGIANIIATDIFDSPDSWTAGKSDLGSATISRNRLTLAVQPGVYMIRLHPGLILDNFYAEITARTSLCKGQDDYGLLVRANAVAFYRFALACDGTLQLERISVNERHPLYPRTPSGDVPPGSPGKVRLGVWAFGPEMRFFLNGRYQFTVIDPNLPSGTLGVFARSSGETVVTVSFSDLVVHAIHYTSPTSMASSTKTPPPTSTPSNP